MADSGDKNTTRTSRGGDKFASVKMFRPTGLFLSLIIVFSRGNNLPDNLKLLI